MLIPLKYNRPAHFYPKISNIDPRIDRRRFESTSIILRASIKANFKRVLTGQLKSADVAADDRFLRQTVMRPAPISPFRVLPRDVQYHELPAREHVVLPICGGKRNHAGTVDRNRESTLISVINSELKFNSIITRDFQVQIPKER